MPTSFERISPAWQLDTLRVALNFLALNDTAKGAYLPANFPEITFHMHSSDTVCSNPLEFMAAFCEDACHVDDMTETVEAALLRIIGVLSALESDQRAAHWRAPEIWRGRTGWSSPSPHVWEALQFLAEDALRQLGWVAEHPARSCRDLLDEFSGHAYSEVAANV